MSVGPIERLGSEKLPEGVSSKGSKVSLGMYQYYKKFQQNALKANLIFYTQENC